MKRTAARTEEKSGMSELQILVIEDDELARKALYDRLRTWGHDVEACDCFADATMLLDKMTFDLIVTDMRLPDGDGIEFIVRLKEKDQVHADVVVITAYADVKTAVEAIKNGAFDYLSKPYEEEQLRKVIRNVADKKTLALQVSSLSELSVKELGDSMRFGEMIGSPALSDIFERARLVARSPDTTVLILGESGTGKGMLAKAIHVSSPRQAKPFVDINCAAIPEQLMESELFGYEKGAFTDAKNKKPGLFEIAHGGTVFLDEIGDMDFKLQGKILKVLEDKAFRRLGAERQTHVDVRIIAATNRDLKTRVEDGRFREDLYYRLTVVPIQMPPLRDHKQSIDPLARYFLQLLSRQMGRSMKGFSKKALAAMQAYDWPGNVRELRNVVERSLILTPGETVEASALGLLGSSSGEMLAKTETASAKLDDVDIPPMSMAECEKKLIVSVLNQVDGNKNKAAEVLKIHRTTLYKKMADYKLG